MTDVFDSAAERIAFSEAVDYIEQGRAQLIPADKAQDYVRRGLMVRQGERLAVTEEGQRQHRIAVHERFSDG